LFVRWINAIFGCVAALLLSACDGGGFVPASGVFGGELLVDQASIGSFNFTVINGAVAGTGTLVHNDQAVTVAISGLLNGTVIDAQIANASLGQGSFTGSFNSAATCAGEFTYADNGGVSEQSGTWTAVVGP
jgi:hypothetical protein